LTASAQAPSPLVSGDGPTKGEVARLVSSATGALEVVEEVERVEVEIEGELVEMASAPTEEARAEATEKWERRDRTSI